ncbi:MAG TPA: hypothetical protein VK444_07595 [Methanobacteriaceae archaeon]|nr:hypothetical protein [Methanobacteriaceae archaeon]
MPKNLQKISLILAVFLLALALSGAATAKVDPQATLPDVFVVDSAASFNGATSLQDAVESANDGFYIQIQPKTYNQQINITKSVTLRGMGTNPEDTIIENSGDYVINIPDGVTVTLENLLILNTGTGRAIIGNFINSSCFTSETPLVPETREVSTSDATVSADTATPETMDTITPDTSLSETTTPDEIAPETTSEMAPEITTPTEPVTPEAPLAAGTTGDPLNDAGMPLASMTWGFMMVVGGVVLPRNR